jgi:integrase
VQKFPDRANLMLQWINPETGKRKSRSACTADEKEAEAKRVDLEADLNNDRYQEASRMSWERFRELAEEEYIAPKRPNTQRNYEMMFNLFEKVCSPRSLRGVSERTLSAFVLGMRRAEVRGRIGMSASTISVYLQLLHSALSWAVVQKFIPAVPTFPDVKVPKKKPQPVPLESFERLLDKAPDANLRTYLLAGWLAGLRLAEAAALEWEATDKAPYVDFLHDRIVLPAEVAKSVEDQWVPLDPVLREALESLPRQGPKVFRFVAPDGHEICPTAIGERVIRLAKRAGVKLTMRALRRGFGCRYAGKVPAQVLQKLMRHQNIATTMGFYANVDEAAMQAVLGQQRNTSRNTTANPVRTSQDNNHANHSPEAS